MLAAVVIVALSYIVPVAAVWMTGIAPAAWETGSWTDIAGLLGGPLLRIGLVLGGMAAMGLVGRGGEFAALGSFGLALARTWSYGRHLGRIGFEPSRSLYGPAGAAVFLLLLLNSIRAYLWAGSVNWKGRSYNVQRARNIAR